MLETTLVIATLLCGLVAGLLFAFAVVAMPGINALPDREFVRAFQVMDGVIQNNQPLFILTWIGSVLGVLAAGIVGLFELDGAELGLLTSAAALYLIGVQLPTVVINVPLNNQLQSVDVDAANAEELARERHAFERRWNKWNNIRATLAVATMALLIIVLLQL